MGTISATQLGNFSVSSAVIRSVVINDVIFATDFS